MFLNNVPAAEAHPNEDTDSKEGVTDPQPHAQGPPEREENWKDYKGLVWLSFVSEQTFA